MDNDRTTKQTKKGRGRPPLSSAEKSQRKIENQEKASVAHKKTGYAAQKKYRGLNPEKYKRYAIGLVIAPEYQGNLEQLLSTTGLSRTELFINAVEEKYGVDLSKKD